MGIGLDLFPQSRTGKRTKNFPRWVSRDEDGVKFCPIPVPTLSWGLNLALIPVPVSVPIKDRNFPQCRAAPCQEQEFPAPLPSLMAMAPAMVATLDLHGFWVLGLVREEWRSMVVLVELLKKKLIII